MWRRLAFAAELSDLIRQQQEGLANVETTSTMADETKPFLLRVAN